MTGSNSNSAQVVLVTGCDTGIGHKLAEAFRQQGLQVIATGLHPENMVDLLDQGIRTCRLDVTQEAEIKALKNLLDEDGLHVDILVNNAGYGAMGPTVEMSMSDARRQYDVNVFGVLAVTQTFAPSMIAHRRGIIVNIGSTSGVLTSPFAGVYCSTKAAVHALGDALRMELAPFGINVVRIEPNQIRTAFGNTAATGLLSRFPPDSNYLAVKDAALERAQGSQTPNAMPAGEFAAKVVAAVLSPNPPARLRVGRQTWPYTLFKPFLPSRAIDRLLMRRFGLDRLS